MKKEIVIYHGECKDGFGGAWAAWKKFGEKARYIPYRHGDIPKTDFSGADVYFIDLAYPLPELRLVKKANKRIVIIDHHKSNADKIAFADESRYEMEHSGSVLAWMYFHAETAVPKLLTFIEDTDLGRWALPHTKEAFAYIGAHPYNFKEWDRLAKTFASAPSRAKAFAEGTLVLARERGIVEELAADAEIVEFEGYRCLAVNSPSFVTAIGTELVRRRPPISIVWSKRAGHYRVSLRSVREVDVAKIAQKYGGGGHKNAAGFTVHAGTQFPWTTTENSK